MISDMKWISYMVRKNDCTMCEGVHVAKMERIMGGMEIVLQELKDEEYKNGEEINKVELIRRIKGKRREINSMTEVGACGVKMVKKEILNRATWNEV